MTSSLSPGTKLGRYEIRSKIGEGGMGEVYLAEDTQLRRRVALKILPSEIAGHQERMYRFMQEAQAAAALNHPNIAHIYEIGETNGTHFIAMEFIDGQTLRDFIHDKETDPGKLLRYLRQVAEGLAKAHAAGIVHRDLKPDNIMVTSDGFAKILDFGLAKLIEPQRPFGLNSGPSSEEAATAILPQHSIAGKIMGTLGYMSPEQARGKVKEIDHRSDIFSFGCILFEAATGQRAFRGLDEIDSLHKIVHGPAPQVKDFNPSAPDQLERIVRRCLAKDPDKRYQAIKDVAIELEELGQEMQLNSSSADYTAPVFSNWRAYSTGSRSGTSQVATRPQQSDPRVSRTSQASGAQYLFTEIKRHKAVALLLLGAFFGCVVALAFLLSRLTGGREANKQTPTLTAARALEMKVARLTASGKVQTAAVSPDGKFLTYVESEANKQSLWTKQIATNSNLQLVAPAELIYSNLTFTPDGNYIYYAAKDQTAQSYSVFRIPTLGGTPAKILEEGGRAVSFSPDGRQIAFVKYDSKASESALVIADADGSNQRKLISLSAHEWFASGGAAWSPDGTHIASGAGDDRQERQMTMVVVNISDGTLKRFVAQRWDSIVRTVWLPDGSGIVFCASDNGTAAAKQLWQVSYPGGEARRITHDLNSYLDLSITADSKTLVAAQRDFMAGISISPDANPDNAQQVTSGHNDGGGGLAWTPDDRIVYVSTASGNTELWVMNRDGSGQKQLTNDSYLKYAPTVSPNGRYAVFVSQSGGIHLWRVDLDGSNPVQLTNGNYDNSPRISPDGQWVVYSSYRSGKLTLWKVAIGGGEPTQLTEGFANEPDISPDGKLVACISNDPDTGKGIIMLLPFAGGAAVGTIGLPPTANWDAGPRWTPDGRAVTFVDRRGETMNLWLQPLTGGPARQISNFRQGGLVHREWSADGKQIAIVRGTATSDAVTISNFHDGR
ncbi:MAG TPA: protein kinase [Pyrinomonadaceae bacterium]|nr:protein kinase [Pyrinomonadaceae bacterium]